MAKQAKPDKTGKDKPGIGHNEMTEEQRQALHLNSHVPAYEKALEAKKAADAALKNVAKLIKAEGGSVAAVKLTIELRSPEGEEAFRARIEREIEVARWNGVGVQVDLFADEMVPSEDRAYEAGKRAGMAGEPRQPPHDPSVPQHHRWLDGHADGQKVLATAGFKKLGEAPAAANKMPA